MKLKFKQVFLALTILLGILALIIFSHCGLQLFSVTTDVGGYAKISSFYQDLTLKSNDTLTLTNIHTYSSDSGKCGNGANTWHRYGGFIKVFIYLEDQLITENAYYYETGDYGSSSRYFDRKVLIDLGQKGIKSNIYNLTTIYYISPIVETHDHGCRGEDQVDMGCTHYDINGCTYSGRYDWDSPMNFNCNSYFGGNPNQEIKCGNETYAINRCAGWKDRGFFASQFATCEFLAVYGGNKLEISLQDIVGKSMSEATPSQLDILVNSTGSKKFKKFITKETLVVYDEYNTTARNDEQHILPIGGHQQDYNYTTKTVIITKNDVFEYNKIVCDGSWFFYSLFVISCLLLIWVRRRIKD